MNVERVVTVTEVVDCVRSRHMDTFSTRDVADALSIERPDIGYSKLEYAVRGAVAWLLNRGEAISVERKRRYTRETRSMYYASHYSLKEESSGCDCNLLNRIFLRVGNAG